MKNIFSYKYGVVFTGKDIKAFLKAWEAKGNSLYGLRQYLNLHDNDYYHYVQLPGSAAGERKKGFIRV